MAHVAADGTVTVYERVVRNGVSPMNPKVKYSQLECGHDLWGPRRFKVGSTHKCPECSRKETEAATRPTQEDR